MSSLRRWIIALAFAAALAPAPAVAGGFTVAEQSATAGGTAGAGTARSDDASAAWYNPAALADGGGLRLGAGILAALPALTVEANDGTWSANSQNGFDAPPHLNGSYAAGRWAAGLSLGVPFGGGVRWPDDWQGRHEIISTRLEVVRIAPFAAWSFGRLRVSAGLHVDLARLQLRRSLDFIDTEGDVRLDMSAQGAGVDASIYYQASDDLALGAAYKSRTVLAFDGGADFTAPAAFDGRAQDQTVTTDMTLPDRLVLGAQWRRDRIALIGDVDLTLWQTNDELAIDFAMDATPDTTVVNDWHATVSARAGAEYDIDDRWRMRGGAFFDPSPAPASNLAPSSPDASRLGATAGMSRRLGERWLVDVFYEYMVLLSRDSDNMESVDASYRGRAHLFGAGVRYQQ